MKDPDILGNVVSPPDTLPRFVVLEALNRLAYYYDSRMRIALKKARESIDADSMESTVISAAHWQAKCDAIYKVAENLELRLKPTMDGET
jgi:hypothetical protein